MNTKTHTQHEGTDTRYETREEGIELEGTHQTTVHKLEDAREHDVSEEGVDNLQPLRCLIVVLVVKLLKDKDQVPRCTAHLEMFTSQRRG